MAISAGERLPEAVLVRIGENGPEQVELGARLKGRRVILFALPGAFTPTCHSAHMPSFVRTADAFFAKGIDEILCIAVNDPHVMRHWGQATGADAAGITVLADPASTFTKAVGMEFTVPSIGFFDRSQRYAMLVEDGVVRVLHLEKPGQCEVSTGEALLAAI